MEIRDTVSFEEAERLLGIPVVPPKKLELVFGKVAVGAYESFVSSPMLREMDYLCLTGAVDYSEIGDYVAFLDDFRDLMRKLEELAHVLGRVLLAKAPYYLEQAFSFMDKGRSRRVDIGKTRLVDMIRIIDEIRAAGMVYTNAAAYRNGFLRLLHLDMTIRHLAALAVSAKKSSYQAPLTQFFVGFLKDAQEDPDSLMWNTGVAFFATMDSLRGCVLPTAGWGKETIADHKVETDAIAQEVFELSYLRDTHEHIAEVDGLRVRVLAPVLEDRESVHRAYGVCCVYVDMPGCSLPLTGHVSRMTGELRFTPSTLSNLEFMIGAEWYARVRRAALVAIRDVLRSKPDDFSWLPLKPTILPPRKEIVSVSLDSSAEERERWARAAREEARAWSDSERERALRERSVATPATPSVGGPALEEQVEAFRALRAAASQDVIVALARILGEPLRTRGSHTIFRGRTDRSYPIPNHGSAPVNIGILKGAFKVLGVTALELKKAL